MLPRFTSTTRQSDTLFLQACFRYLKTGFLFLHVQFAFGHFSRIDFWPRIRTDLHGFQIFLRPKKISENPCSSVAKAKPPIVKMANAWSFITLAGGRLISVQIEFELKMRVLAA
ncbi:hypothetical protein HUU40_02900 [candidate division KSB1 bacterium]|nr:hypothetical protein [candidate division KSB1 bacterium]